MTARFMSIPPEQDGLEFDAEPHRYRYHGDVVPSVTGILRSITDAIYGDIPSWQVQAAADRGTQAHRATELDDIGILAYERLDPELVPYVDAWRAFVAETGFEVEAIELRRCHPVWRYATTLDRVGILNGKRAVVELKTTAALHPWVALQTAGQLEAYNATAESRAAHATQRWAVRLGPDGRYQCQQYSNTNDWPVFLACLTRRRWMQEHGLMPKDEDNE